MRLIRSLVITALFAIAAFGQGLTLAPVAKQQFFDLNGNPLSGGTLETFVAGTTTHLATFTSWTGSAQNQNPLTLDSAGRADIWLSAASYKFLLKNSAGVTQWTVDNISGQGLVGPLANLQVGTLLTTVKLTFPNGGFCDTSGCTGVQFNGATAFLNGIGTGASSSSVIYIGSGNFFNRVYSGANASCLGINDGWMGLRVDTDTLQYCSGGARFDVGVGATGGGPSLTADQTWTGSNTFSGGAHFTGLGLSTTVADITIGPTGNLYLRYFAGGNASCGAIANVWVGIRTDTNELQACINGVLKKVSLL